MKSKLFAILFALVLLLPACATKTKIEYVDREVVKYNTKYVHDTLTHEVHDSIYHTVYQVGDTIYNVKYVDRIRYKDRVVVKGDTCWRDSIQVIYQQEVKTKKYIPKWVFIVLPISLLISIFAVIKLLKWH